MDQVKEAFSKVKEDMDSLKSEVNYLKNKVSEIQESLIDLVEIFKEFKQKQDFQKQQINHSFSQPQKYFSREKIPKLQPRPLENTQKTPENYSLIQQTDRHINPTTSTHTSTHSYQYKGLKPQNLGISNGNQGVPTDRQTDRQTHQQTDKSSHNQDKSSIDNAVEILESLDNIKKEIRLKFKRLTEQEMLIFSTLYQLEEENGHTDYKTISEKINLSESSIRDYIGRLIKKGIPVDKTKLNNKTIQLNVSKNLKKIASLNTILQLREL